MKNLVYIKGTKQGLVLQLDDQCAYTDLLTELQAKVSDPALDGSAEVQVNLGYRYCTEAQQKEIVATVQSNTHLRVSKMTSDVITVEESNRRIQERQSETYVGIVRSGQIVKADGDLVVVGDVNPNGKVVAGGNIYVLGRLKGQAHAGANGNLQAVIAASWLEATHLKIHETLEIMTDELTVLSEQPEMECAYLHNNGHIIIDRLQELRYIRPEISTFKGGS
ncbi:septum site-determining protein MinC [Planococcus sp. N028]|uniref:Probable septum site-determining protein MinC n=1 Tax=Planococcus shixiaomingii TaxID=3058393 RepID=A0ABT8MXJ3_9BACL|nr:MULTISPECIES: septum site-determining protein MinC [unclassified Planococcus (in: firmicutes)]MDN7240362.1 septum site-determining protein MinC [Planococcus sp. N028]WKA56259.1 septum site-determining protein MinC [Planococcus sp. N022]